MSLPRIGVVMPAWNNERHIDAALASLAAQDGVDLDIVVVDDGSTDTTAAIVADHAGNDARIRLMRQPHRGIAASRNAALGAVAGDLVAFVDADDLCPRGRLARQAAYFLRDPALDVVYADILYFRGEADIDGPAPGTPTIRTSPSNLSSSLFARRLLDRVGLFDEDFVYGDDIDLLMRIREAAGATAGDPEIGAYQRRHDGNWSRDIANNRRDFMKAVHRSLQRRRASGGKA